MLETDGRKIRSAYQVVEMILRRQPGDRLAFVVQQGDQRRELELTLGGSPAQSASPAGAPQGVVIGPHLTVKATGGGVEVRTGGQVQELSTDPPARVRRSPGNEVELLKSQLLAFEQVIRKLQAELQQRGELQQETDKIIKSLQAEVEQLHKQLEEKSSAKAQK